MHPCLRPELRAAQRVLRVIIRSPKSSPRIVVRSFASFSRLSEAHTPDAGVPAPHNAGPSTFPAVASSRLPLNKSTPQLPAQVAVSINHFHHSQLRDSPENITWEPQSVSDVPIPIPEYGEGFEGLYRSLTKFRAELDERDKLDHWRERDRRKSRDEKDIAHWLHTGEVPAEHRLLERFEDIPFHLREYIGKFAFSTQLPCLYSDSPLRAAHWHPVGSSHRDIQGQDSQEESSDMRSRIVQHLKAEIKGDAPMIENLSSGSGDQQQNTLYHGSWQRRRKRMRDNKPVQSNAPVPQWFLDCNVSHAEVGAPRRVGTVATLPKSSHIPTASAAEDAQVQLPPQESVPEQQPEPRLTTYGKGRSGPAPDEDSGHGSSPSRVPTSTIVNTKSLGDNRYFIDESQYEELLNTFKGRLQSPVNDSSAQNKVFSAMNHMTILHGSRDSELLLDALVRDLCNTVDANHIHLDAQDITEFVVQTETGKQNVRRGARLSWKLYKSLYGADEYQESAFPKQEDEENEEDEEEDEENESNSIDIPISSFMSGIGGKLPDIFKRFGQRPQNNGVLGNMLDTSVSYAPTINAIFSTVLETPKSGTESAKDGQEAPTAKPSKPLIVHLENYRILQENPYSETFMATLLEVADDRRAAGQTVMIVGTDSLRDFSKSSDPRSILENQASKSYGASTAVVLTPVFPDRDAELALSEDRKTRIRNINARHIQQVLKSRGQLFHGLEDGFWKDDYREAIGQRDHDALSNQFWSFVQVQRIAAIMAGIQSDAPLEDACSIISASDESKVAWAQRNQPDLYKQGKKEETRSDDRQLRSIRAKASRHEKKLLSGVIEPKKIQTTFQDIHIPVETVDALKMLTTLSLQRPEAFRYGVLKSDRIPGLLLYGPPGTGKTLAAKAVAKESGATMLEVSAADLNDMYVGEGEKNVQALFSLAKKLSPCVVFLDEADAMFSARSQSRRASHRELLNQFLKEWDGMSNDAGSAFIMVATNRPMDLDDAVLRRLPRRLLVDLPTEADRLKILHIHLRNEEMDADVKLDDLAKLTPFYSGSDLKNVAVAAALNAVRDENDAAASFRLEKPEEKYEYPERRVLTQKHFEKALEEITASISQDMSSLREIKKFDEQYGDKKGRKRKSPKWGFKSAAEADKVLDTVKVRS